jgi:hypothetical protein
MSEKVLLVRVAELATLISLSPRKIEYLRGDRLIPHVKCGRAILYSPPAVVAALERLGGRGAIANASELKAHKPAVVSWLRYYAKETCPSDDDMRRRGCAPDTGAR